MKVLVADKFPAAEVDALTAAGCVVACAPDIKDEALAAALAAERPSILIVRSTEVQTMHLAAAPTLALIIRAGAGVNTIDVAEASARGVYVANCPGKNSVAVAELAFAHILSLDRRLVDGALDLRSGIWNKKGYQKAQGILGRTLGLLGLGGIGREMIPRAHAFGMDVVAWSRSLTPSRAEALGVTYGQTPADVARQCDVLSVHLALNEETRGLVDAALLADLRDGAIVINTSRGDVIDQPALQAAVQQGRIRAGLDVFANEPTVGSGEFDPGVFSCEGVQGTHHIGASTAQAQAAVAEEVVRIVTTFLSEGSVLNCVNLADHADATHLLVVRHRDEVGVLASVLGTLREAGINVQEMENVLFKGGDAACARIQLDRAPHESVLKELRAASEHILAVGINTL
ncbi:MAG: hydroxyacid dehydrogenase [Planctomycetes bacterium]|nr:hydroxyacid dehydrogenase [Planctomycetota bacterium]